jgi:hypothetical protein
MGDFSRFAWPGRSEMTTLKHFHVYEESLITTHERNNRIFLDEPTANAEAEKLQVDVTESGLADFVMVVQTACDNVGCKLPTKEAELDSDTTVKPPSRDTKRNKGNARKAKRL